MSGQSSGASGFVDRQASHARWKDLSNSEDRTLACREYYAELLWRAFPSRSENELADKASLVLGKSKKQIRNQLRLLHDAPAKDFLSVLIVVGAEIVFQGMENEQIEADQAVSRGSLE